MRDAAILTAALLSGVSALVCQVSWVRRLGDALGHGAVAVAIVLATFFAGLGLGARLLGPLADRARRPARLYLWIELGIAGWALGFLVLVGWAEALWFAAAPLELSAVARALVAALVAATLLLPPCVLLGGTLPVLARLLVAGRTDGERTLGRRFAWLYGVNTLGAALGAALAGFVLLPGLGLADALRVAAVLNVAAGVVVAPLRVALVEPVPERTRRPGPAPEWLAAAAVSGFVGIGCEVVWTRALAARLSSTVHSFSILLTVFLLALALGAFVVARLDRRGRVGPRTVALLLVATAVAALGSSAAIAAFGALRRSAGTELWRIQGAEALTAVLVLAPPCLCLGATFPAVLRVARRAPGGLGADLGRVQLANTLGAVAAALVVGFVALPALGMTGTLLALAALAAATGIVLLPRPDHAGLRPFRVHVAAAAAVALAAVLLTTDLRLWRNSAGDRLVAYREGRAASVAVVDQADGNRVLKVDQTYRLGGVRGRYPQVRQGVVPLLLHGAARRALSIGVGTGGSAGAAAAFGTMELEPLELDAVEILPEVAAMLPWFDRWTEGFAARAAREPETRVHVADARHFVRAAQGRRYDVVFGDLFVPWRPGEGAMYTREHFAAIRRLLADGGVFVQWLPVYQLGVDELRTIVATFVDVFPGASAVWLYLNARTPTLGLCGGERALRLPPDLGRAWDDEARAALLREVGLAGPADVAALWLCGRDALVRFADAAPLETLLRPRVEFTSARNQPLGRAVLAGAALRALAPLAADPAPWLDGLPDAGARARLAAARAVLAAAIAHEHDRRGDREVDALVDAIAADPTWSDPVDRLARAARVATSELRWADAERAIAALRALPGLDLRGWRLLARLRESQGHRALAIAECRALLAAYPGDDEITAFLERLAR